MSLEVYLERHRITIQLLLEHLLRQASSYLYKIDMDFNEPSIIVMIRIKLF